jgi:hypothetical protein
MIAVSAVIRLAISAGRFSSKIFLHGFADIADNPLAQPADKIESKRGGNADDNNDSQQPVKIGRRISTAFYKALIDHQPQAIGNGKGRGGGSHQCHQGKQDLARIADCEGRNHPQAAEFRLFLRRFRR